MAIDTRLKRSTALNVGSPWRGILPAPDGEISSLDTPALLQLYAGLGAEPPVVLPHLPRQLREAVATALTGLSTTGARVYQSRVYPLQDAGLPALRIYTRSEAATVETISTPALMSTLVEVVVEGSAKANADLDDTLDAIANEVKAVLGAGLVIEEKFVPLWYRGFDIEMSGDGERPTGTIVLRFEARLLYRATTPNVFA